jgi:formimidoylglutamate deiminase
VCPTTEANLADGYVPVGRLRDCNVGLCIGSDSNVRIDPFEELRELEGIGRRESGRRNVSTADELLEIGSAEGAAALGLDVWPGIEIDLDHPSLEGVACDDIRDALVMSCSADVVQ